MQVHLATNREHSKAQTQEILGLRRKIDQLEGQIAENELTAPAEARHLFKVTR
jgi:hypothetical protein